MPNHRNEPRIYTGRVFMMFGNQMGELVRHPYAVAQNLVASGQARWEGDETPLPRHVKAMIEARQRERDQQVAADAAINAEKLNAPKVQPVDPDLVTNARPILFGSLLLHGDNFLLKPWPAIAEIVKSLVIEVDEPTPLQPGEIALARSRNVVAVKARNRDAAIFDVVGENDDFIYAVHREPEKADDDEPVVEIPADWRESHHMKKMSIARRLMGLDNSAAMTKDEAEAIIEQWTAPDDPVQEENPEGARNEQGRKLDGNHAPAVNKDGVRQKSGEEIAAEQQRKILDAEF